MEDPKIDEDIMPIGEFSSMFALKQRDLMHFSKLMRMTCLSEAVETKRFSSMRCKRNWWRWFAIRIIMGIIGILSTTQSIWANIQSKVGATHKSLLVGRSKYGKIPLVLNKKVSLFMKITLCNCSKFWIVDPSFNLRNQQ